MIFFFFFFFFFFLLLFFLHLLFPRTNPHGATTINQTTKHMPKSMYILVYQMIPYWFGHGFSIVSIPSCRLKIISFTTRLIICQSHFQTFCDMNGILNPKRLRKRPFVWFHMVSSEMEIIQSIASFYSHFFLCFCIWDKNAIRNSICIHF